MKQSILMLLAIGLMMPICYSQNKNDGKGPKAKNYKIWHDNSHVRTTVFSVTQADDRIMGPKAKNQMRRQRLNKMRTYVRTNSESVYPTGPRAKNHQAFDQLKKRSAHQVARKESNKSLPAGPNKRK